MNNTIHTLAITLIVTIGAILSGCKNETDIFIGEWSNQINGKGDMKISIFYDGEHITLKEEVLSSGKVIGIYRAKYSDGYLMTDDSIVFDKLFYSESEQMLIPLNQKIPNLPGFRRI